jgi:hypothetical protein
VVPWFNSETVVVCDTHASHSSGVAFDTFTALSSHAHATCSLLYFPRFNVAFSPQDSHQICSGVLSGLLIVTVVAKRKEFLIAVATVNILFIGVYWPNIDVALFTLPPAWVWLTVHRTTTREQDLVRISAVE